MDALLAVGVVVLVVIALVVMRLLNDRPPAAQTPASRGTAEVTQLPSAATPLDENVQFTVYRPREVVPSRWYQLLVFAHLTEALDEVGDADTPDPLGEVQRQATRLLDRESSNYRPTSADATQAIPRHGELTLRPELEGVESNPREYAFRWEQPVHRAEFNFRVISGAGPVPRTVRGRVTIFLGPIIVGDVPLTIPVVAMAPIATADAETALDRAEPQVIERARPYRQIFASYSHRDLQVVEQFETFVHPLGDRYLRDVRDLRSGEVWTDGLRELIRRADVFQLFWSWNAMASPFVRQEWEFALGLQRPDFIRPVYWEDPLPQRAELPPQALLQLHFHQVVLRASAHPAGPAMIAPPAPPTPIAPPAPTASTAPPASASSPSAATRVRWLMTMPGLATAAAVLVTGLLTTQVFMWLSTVPTGVSTMASSADDPAPPPPPPPPPSPAPPIDASKNLEGPELLGKVHIPRAVLANGQRLAAGTYRVFLAAEKGDERWVDFRRDDGTLAGREVATVIPPADVATIAKGDAPRPGHSRVDKLEGDNFLRVWLNARGTHYLIHLAPAEE